MRVKKCQEPLAARKRKAYETKIKNDLEWGENITPHIDNHDGTRLDRSRILRTDEDNLW